MALTPAQVDEFERLLEPHLDTAYRVALRMAKNSDDASDLVHEAVVNALNGFESFTPGTNFRAWFLRILTNAFLQIRRKSGRVEVVDIDETPELLLFRAAQNMPEGTEDPAAELINKLAVEQISQAVDSLPDDYRMTLSLYLMNEMSYEEIAQVLAVPLGTIRSRIHRGRNLLQRELAHLLESEGTLSAGGAR